MKYLYRYFIYMSELFDIVLPIGPNDIDNYEQILEQIAHTKRNVLGYRKIYIITTRDVEIDGCIVVHENSFPFTIRTVAELHGKNERNGWYLQQLLKLYAGFVLPDILDRYLVIDIDTFFMKPTRFVDDEHRCLYNPGTEFHVNYFIHMEKLHPTLKRMFENYSGISHHMIFETKIINTLFEMVQDYHSRNGSYEPFWKLFLTMVTERDREFPHSGASEYEIYFNYVLQYHANKVVIRPLKRSDVKVIDFTNQEGYDYVSRHWWW